MCCPFTSSPVGLSSSHAYPGDRHLPHALGHLGILLKCCLSLHLSGVSVPPSAALQDSRPVFFPKYVLLERFFFSLCMWGNQHVSTRTWYSSDDPAFSDDIDTPYPKPAPRALASQKRQAGNPAAPHSVPPRGRATPSPSVAGMWQTSVHLI